MVRGQPNHLIDTKIKKYHILEDQREHYLILYDRSLGRLIPEHLCLEPSFNRYRSLFSVYSSTLKILPHTSIHCQPSCNVMELMELHLDILKDIIYLVV